MHRLVILLMFIDHVLMTFKLVRYDGTQVHSQNHIHINVVSLLLTMKRIRGPRLCCLKLANLMTSQKARYSVHKKERAPRIIVVWRWKCVNRC